MAGTVEAAGGPARPRLLPSTLLWQTFLLVALLLIVALGSWVQIFRYFQEPARSRDVAQMVVSVINLTRTALINALTFMDGNVSANERALSIIYLVALSPEYAVQR